MSIQISLIKKVIVILFCMISITTLIFTKKSFKEVDDNSINYALGQEDYDNYLEKTGLIIEKNVTVYEDLKNFLKKGELKYLDEVNIKQIYLDSVYSDSNNNIVIFCKIENSKINGWINLFNILFPYYISENGTFGIKQAVRFFDEIKQKIIYYQLIYSTKKKFISLDLFEISKIKENSIFIERLSGNKITFEDKNNDGLKEIVLHGKHSEGIWGTDVGKTTDAEIWFNLKKDKIVKIFTKKIKGDFWGMSEWEYKYDIDKNKSKNFIETIKAVYIEKEGDKVIKQNLIFHWDGEKYISVNDYFTPTINNLRFRETPDLNGKFIRSLKQGEKLELIEKGKTETINGTKGTWVKVKTEKGEIGWCFDAYLKPYDEVKKK